MDEQELKEIEDRNITQIPMLLGGHADTQTDVIRLVAEVRALRSALEMAAALAALEGQQRRDNGRRAELAMGEAEAWKQRYWAEARKNGHDLAGETAWREDDARIEAELTK